MKKFDKIVCVGWPKTGTSTIGDALIMLGYEVVGCRLDLAEPLLEGNTESLLQLSERFEAFQDHPWCLYYQLLDEKFENCGFILTTRPESQWLESAKAHFGRLNYEVPMFELAYGVGHIAGNEEFFLNSYREHIRQVRDYFRGRSDFLELDISRGLDWEEICDFLEIPRPKRAFPHSNQAYKKRSPAFRAIERLKKLLPESVVIAGSNVKQTIRKLQNKPDPRNRFHNSSINQETRERWSKTQPRVR